MQELKTLRDNCENVYGSKGGIGTEREFDEYNGYAKELLEVLARSIPSMLMKEAFFKNTFGN